MIFYFAETACMEVSQSGSFRIEKVPGMLLAGNRLTYRSIVRPVLD